jgi:hypothetical protein
MVLTQKTNMGIQACGEFAWRGPYIDRETHVDPWGNQYVISARYPPGGADAANHRVLVLSAGKDAVWLSPFSDGVTRLTTPDDSPYGPHDNDGSYVHDDIGVVVCSNN